MMNRYILMWATLPMMLLQGLGPAHAQTSQEVITGPSERKKKQKKGRIHFYNLNVSGPLIVVRLRHGLTDLVPAFAYLPGSGAVVGSDPKCQVLLECLDRLSCHTQFLFGSTEPVEQGHLVMKSRCVIKEKRCRLADTIRTPLEFTQSLCRIPRLDVCTTEKKSC